MELIASVSRSSGLEKDGDALRDPKIQQEYRAFIQGKVDEYWKRHPLSPDDTCGETAAAARNRKENEENLLILFRKLREGLLSTNRRDEFALEVYEMSLYLSVLFKSPVQTTSALSHLFPDLYISIASQTTASPSTSNTPKVSTASTRAPSTPTPPRSRHPPPPERPLASSALASTVILLLHHLVVAYPSQIPFYTHLRQLHPALLAVLGTPVSVLVQDPSSAEAVPSELARASPLTSPTKPKPTSTPEPAPHLASEPNSRPPAASSRAATEARTSSSVSITVSAFASASAREPPTAPSPPSDAPSAESGCHSDGLTSTRASRPSSESRLGSARAWLRELARCLGARNYARLEALTRREVFEAFVRTQGGPRRDAKHMRPVPIALIDAGGKARTTQRSGQGGGDGCDRDLALEAIGVLVGALLEKARGTTWSVLRTAYREVSLGATPIAPAHDAGTTGDWLARSLVLRTRAPRSTAGSDSGGAGVGHARLEAWLEERCGKGEARRKEGEGMEGRWMFVKA
ncbi:hypothetical protein LXA43DRAFT_971018 [Ganoderma leucocontextum]|nr:hypothetical protein LXA43DRAFT_971018 [Ganoderma leucocontextum]